jgi:hypothetical protein
MNRLEKADYPVLNTWSWFTHISPMDKHEPKPLTVKPTMTLAQLKARFSTIDACKQFLIEHRWPDAVKCPRCGNPKVSELNFKP